MSVLGTAKSDRHRKAHHVESGGTARKFWHLTRGDLCGESREEVSRGHSSEEAAVMGAERRAEEPKTPIEASGRSASSILKPSDAATAAAIRTGGGVARGGFLKCDKAIGCERPDRAATKRRCVDRVIDGSHPE